MKSSRHLPFNTHRDAWVEVNLSALEHNIGCIRRHVSPPVDVMAVVKADAYGHGVTLVLPTLEAYGVSMLGVSSMDEALQIRGAGVQIPILVLGVTPDWAMQEAIKQDIQLTIFSQRHLDGLKQLYQQTGQVVSVHVKVDTGMHRIGVPWQSAADFITAAQQQPGVQVMGVFSHLAKTQDNAVVCLQVGRWQQVLHSLAVVPTIQHLSNSAAMWHHSQTHCNMVRVGMALFGYASDDVPLPVTLQPVMGLKARVVNLQTLLSNEGVSYYHSYVNTSNQPRVIATLPLGYADGVPRALSNQIQVAFRGQLCLQVGQISMDQLMVDVTDIPDITVGDVITLLGQSGSHHLTLSTWADVVNTIEYELMCALRVRLPKIVVR